LAPLLDAGCEPEQLKALGLTLTAVSNTADSLYCRQLPRSRAHLTTRGTGNGAFAGLAAMAKLLTLEATQLAWYED